MNLGPRFNNWKLAFLSAVVLVVHQACQGHAFAGAIATPNGLHGGDQFRFIFVTPTSVKTDATSTDISVYNNLVNTYASGFSYNGTALSAKAIVSVYGGTNAITNVGVDNVAVYSVSNEVAAKDDNVTGLFSASQLISQPIQDLSGNSYTSGYVFTGTSGLGTEYYTTNTNVGTVYWGLGGPSDNGVVDNGTPYPNVVEVGVLHSNVGALPGAANPLVYDWLSYGYGTGLQDKSNPLQLYGVSQVFTVVPEPSTFLISGLGILMVGLARKSRKQN